MNKTISSGAAAEMKGVRDARAQEYFYVLEGPMKSVAISARELLLSIEPNLDEVLKWGLPIYGQPKNIFSIVAHQKHVNFQFFNGAHLSAHKELIAGTGKNLRHVRLISVDDVQNGTLEAQIREALSLGFTKNR